MSDEQLHEKFHVLADDILGTAHAGRLLKLTHTIESRGDLPSVLQLWAERARNAWANERLG